MRSSISRVLIYLLCLSLSVSSRCWPTNNSASQPVVTDHAQRHVAWYYAANPPVAELAQYTDVVLEPDNVTAEQVTFLRQQQVITYAYLSLGEYLHGSGHGRVAKRQPDLTINPDWVLGTNSVWGGSIMDWRQPGWQQFILNRFIPDRLAKGFDGLFLDTLDSYQQVVKSSEFADHAAALADLIRQIKRQYPAVRLIVNRGFEVLERIAPQIEMVALESLVSTWEPSTNTYRAVTEQERNWLLQQVAPARQHYLPVVSIDYVPVADIGQTHAKQVAKQATRFNVIPWVTTPALDVLGTSLLQPIPRRVLLAYDGDQIPLSYHPIHQSVATVIEYLGFIPEYLDVRRDQLPRDLHSGLYAGLVLWVGRMASHLVMDWINEALTQQLPLVFLDDLPPTSDALSEQLGLARQRVTSLPLTVAYRHPDWVPDPNILSSQGRNELIHSTAPNSQALLRLQHPNGELHEPVFVAPWGGLALSPYFLDRTSPYGSLWITDPFQFLKQALRLPDLPAPDPTTESGRRIVTAHIDGDGFVNRAEMPGTPYACEVILEQVLKKYPIPYTVSVIEAEVSPAGAYPEHSETAEAIARQIFALPHVEIASHTYSHPFVWDKATFSQVASLDDLIYGDALKLEGYQFNLEREIRGSVAYINERLSPPNKKVNVFLWSGDALPNAEAVAMTRQLGLINVNGGNTKLTRSFPDLSRVYPMGRPTAGGLQIYAPAGNENIYTNLWTGPFYGYRMAVENFELTGAPRRLKPISLYYHFYSGSKQGALRALHINHQWIDKQSVTPLFLSEYAQRAEGFYHASFAWLPDGRLQVKGLGALRTLRLPTTLGWPDPQHSQQLAGWLNDPTGRYLTLTASNGILRFTRSEPQAMRLVEANAPLQQWQPITGGIQLRFTGHVPVQFTVYCQQPCELKQGDRRITGSRTKHLHTYQLTDHDTGPLRLLYGQ